ncbi:tetratricopeptide repeat protein [Ruegeria sp.]|uniref:tetratricopeptide repeat protein n=1 Tax=Ruegeria sp. TaxID=1879320 RepID=UPI003B59E6FC
MSKFYMPAVVAAAMVGVSSVSGNAKPLLTNSQSTYSSACLEQVETPERLIEICQHGLDNAGASDRQRIEMLDRLAWAYFDLGNFERSDDAFMEILDLDPKAELGLQGRGWVSFVRDDFTSASAWFRKAVSRTPTAANLSGLAASERRDGQVEFSEFEERMRVALALNPEYTWGLRELAWSLTDYSRNDEALELFRSAVEVDSYDANAEYGIAYTLSEMNEWEEAFSHITRALELDPEFTGAKSRRSLILLMLNRPKQALKDAEAVIAAGPEDEDGYVRKARALSALGRRAEAHYVLETAEEKAGPSGYLLYWRADLLADDHDFSAALDQIRRSVAFDDASHFNHRLHAEIALWLEKVDEAREAIDLALQGNPGEPYLQFVEARVMIGEGEFKAAETAFDAAVEAGLPEERLSDFLTDLVVEGRFMQALSMRLRYSTATQG